MNIYEAFSDAIIERLSLSIGATVNGLEIIKLTEFNQEHKDILTSSPGRITVAIWQEKFGTDLDNKRLTFSDAAQDSDIYAVCTISARTIYGDRGVLEYGDICQSLLMGMPAGTRGGYTSCYGFEFAAHTKSAWHYRFIVRLQGVPRIAIEDLESEFPLYPGLIKNIKFLREYMDQGIETNDGSPITTDTPGASDWLDKY